MAKTCICLVIFLLSQVLSENQVQAKKKSYRVTTVVAHPFVYRNESHGANPEFYGFVPDVLQKAAELLNVTFSISLAKDGKYGPGYNKSNMFGMIGELIRNEKDIAAADLYICAKRAEYVHYSQPFLNFGLRILIKKPPTWQDTEGFAFVFSPLKAEVWLIAVVAFVIVSVLLTLIAKFSPCEGEDSKGGLFDLTSLRMTFPNNLIFTFGTLMWQGYKRTPVSIAGRTLTCFWWLFSLFFLTMYGANLTAFFLRKEPLHHTVPFATFDELSKQTDVKYGIRDIIYVRNYYNYSSNTHVDRRIYKEIMKDPGLMVNSFQEGFDRVRQGNGKYAFIADSPYIEFMASQPPCDTMVVGEPRAEFSMGFACRNETSVCNDLDVAIATMKSHQYLAKLRRKWLHGECVTDAEQEVNWNGVTYKTRSAVNSLTEEKAVSLKRFGMPVIILVVGIILSMAILAVELMWSKRTRKVKLVDRTQDEQPPNDTLNIAE